MRRAFATTTYYDPTLSARAIGSRTSSVPAAVDDVSAEEERLIHSIFSAGILTPFDGFKVAERGAGANMSVDVGSGSAKSDIAFLNGTVAGQGLYMVRLDDTVDNLTIEPADATLNRIDEIYLAVQDDAYDSNGSFSLPRLVVRKGDVAGSPSPPGPDGSWTAYLLLGSVSVLAAVTSISDSDITDERVSATPAVPMVPTGSILAYGGVSAPTGWLLCNGTAISRTTYARLFSILGTTFGTGDGSTTFNLPDLRQRLPLGKAASGTGNVLGATGGAIDHTHTGPSHTHTGPSHTHTGPSHTHTIAHTHSIDPPSTASTSAGSHAHTGSTGGTLPEGTTGSPSYNAAGSGHLHSISTESAHTHSVNIAAFTSAAASTGSSGSDGTGNTGSGGTGATGASGTAVTGTQNPPFLVVNYIVRT